MTKNKNYIDGQKKDAYAILFFLNFQKHINYI